MRAFPNSQQTLLQGHTSLQAYPPPAAFSRTSWEQFLDKEDNFSSERLWLSELRNALKIPRGKEGQFSSLTGRPQAWLVEDKVFHEEMGWLLRRVRA